MTVRNGWSVMRNSVHALFLRELKTRFGEYRLGYLWALLEPVAHMVVMLAIIGYLLHRTMPDISFPVFLLCGIVPYSLFSNIALRSLNAIEANRGLFSYRPVHPVDAVLARSLLECLIQAACFSILMAGLWLLGESMRLDALPALLSIWLALALLSQGIGFSFMVLGHAFKAADKILPILIKPLYFASGVMFSLHIIPAEYRWLVDWNPLLHAFELMRHAVFPAYPLYGVSLAYLWLCALLMLFFGLLLYKAREPAILRS
ncbi:ABC transporter permease [Chromobacterium vaccinii]|uniref:ABC transporter permease n=1 Tax=Chromobacterium piscinae TaxID=686831 RepID=UPI00140A8DF6|nr:ABC transporter permease [Chromobacterium vaccinii]MBX9359611.1 ABC transporter permease [Chromobacterium vaccinii]NHQ81874.1 ABC transporter permease [Chromobacterium vaccinii]